MCFSEYPWIHAVKDSDRAKRMKKRDVCLILYHKHISETNLSFKISVVYIFRHSLLFLLKFYLI